MSSLIKTVLSQKKVHADIKSKVKHFLILPKRKNILSRENLILLIHSNCKNKNHHNSLNKLLFKFQLNNIHPNNKYYLIVYRIIKKNIWLYCKQNNKAHNS
jgi:hypothetical protein